MLKYSETFWDRSNRSIKKTFISRLNNIGPKNQAKEHIQGGQLPYYFIYAEQLTQGFKYTIDSLPAFFGDYIPMSNKHVYE